MDITADPCEDFYRFSCGGWIDSNVIPDGKSGWGHFYELRDKVDNALKSKYILRCPFWLFKYENLAIVSTEEPSESSAVTSLRAMFNGCMDTEGIEAAGLTRILNQVGASGTYGGWPMIQDSWTDEKYCFEF